MWFNILVSVWLCFAGLWIVVRFIGPVAIPSLPKRKQAPKPEDFIWEAVAEMRSNRKRWRDFEAETMNHWEVMCACPTEEMILASERAAVRQRIYNAADMGIIPQSITPEIMPPPSQPPLPGAYYERHDYNGYTIVNRPIKGSREELEWLSHQARINNERIAKQNREYREQTLQDALEARRRDGRMH